MAAKAPAPDPAGIAALPSIALSLRQGDASACERAAVQLRDLAATGSGDTQIAACVAIANNSDLVDAAFVQALRRPGLSDTVQHALVVTMMSMLLHDDVKHESTPMMLACPYYMPVLLRIIAQPRSRYIPQTPLSKHHTLFVVFTFCCSFEAIRSIARFIYGKYGKANAQSLPLGLPRILVRVINDDSDTTDNRVCAMFCLSCMATHAPASVLGEQDTITCALRIIQQQGTGNAPIPLAPLPFFARRLLIAAPSSIELTQASSNPCPPSPLRHEAVGHQSKIRVHSDEQNRRVLAVCVTRCHGGAHAASQGRSIRTPAHIVSGRRRAAHCQRCADVPGECHGQP